MMGEMGEMGGMGGMGAMGSDGIAAYLTFFAMEGMGASWRRGRIRRRE